MWVNKYNFKNEEEGRKAMQHMHKSPVKTKLIPKYVKTTSRGSDTEKLESIIHADYEHAIAYFKHRSNDFRPLVSDAAKKYYSLLKEVKLGITDDN